MKVGITDLVLRMVEGNTVMRDLSLENPIRAIREIGRRASYSAWWLANGRELTAIEMQTEYFEKTERFIERRGPMRHRRCCSARSSRKRWTRSATLRTRTPRSQGGLDHEADADRTVHGQARTGAGLTPDRAAGPGLSRREPGARPLLPAGEVGQGRASRRRCPDQPRDARAPQTTRAKLRGDFIRQAKAKRRDYTVVAPQTQRPGSANGALQGPVPQ